uniref:uncharacterized protein LOC101309803 isoform X2 n=1 Tax=Fragaria vesca subsp. vesca TaxID=101020 RepID=UPI0005CAECE7|nr:PREDICTED: uncharacterized protein LOC101309803 isoform X2 [Fragaria vesca subsp. vesca]
MASDDDIELVARDEGESEVFHLAGALLAERPPHPNSVTGGLRRAWSSYGEEDDDIQVFMVNDRLYSIVVKQEEIAKQIVNSGPWNIDDRLMNVVPWPRELAIEDIDFSPIQFWIQIHFLPLGMLSEGSARNIGRKVGRVIEIEDPIRIPRSFLRLKVVVDGKKPLYPGFWHGPARKKIRVKYEKLCDFCYSCGRIGHPMRLCKWDDGPADADEFYNNDMRVGVDPKLDFNDFAAPSAAENGDFWTELAKARVRNARMLARVDMRGNGDFLDPALNADSANYFSQQNQSEAGNNSVCQSGVSSLAKKKKKNTGVSSFADVEAENLGRVNSEGIMGQGQVGTASKLGHNSDVLSDDVQPRLPIQVGTDAAIVAVPTATDSTPPPSPPHDSDVSPVGSPDRAAAEVQRLPSDEDPDQAAAGGLTEDLKQKIIKQVEYYFSDENLSNDKHMLSWIKKDEEGFVPISVIASYKKTKKLVRNNSSIAVALKESSLLVVSSNGKKVKRLHPLPSLETRDPKFTVLVENLPADHSVENLKKMFSEAGNIKDICILDPSAIDASAKGGKVEKPISNKLHALIEYDTVEATEKAVAILNNEEDWRNGMRVKLLKQMSKYGQSAQRRQSRGGFDSEKSSSIRTSEAGIEETHNASEHHNGTPDEEDGGGQLPKEKTGHRGRNRGQSGRQKYLGLNGFGHGTTSSAHPIEPSKPPPGPRMPDGTRGFTTGRGRTPVSVVVVL